LYTNVQACPSQHQTCCPVYGQEYGTTEVLSGKGTFRLEGRLTGFRRARKIVRIRTNAPAANDAIVSTPLPQGIATIATFDSLTLA
jgi:hypothetical protein